MTRDTRRDPASDVMIACPCCNGAGVVRLGGHYLKTLRALQAHGKPISGVELARIVPGVKPTAMNNRLRQLEKKGLVESLKDGRAVYWIAKGGSWDGLEE